MIEVLDLHKSYGDVPRVSGLSFRVESGQVLALVGANGAGKSTTLRTLAGILSPTQGTLKVAGFDVVRQPVEAKRATAYVPDHPQLFPELTARQHLAFVAGVYEIDEANSRIDELLERFQLRDKQHEPAATLSRGMLQKLMLCGACLQRPSALLLDEPLTGLDPQGIRVVKETIAELCAGGAAVILSSHLLEVVERICGHVVLLDQGRRLFFGSMSELHEEHARHNSSTLEQIYLKVTASPTPCELGEERR